MHRTPKMILCASFHFLALSKTSGLLRRLCLSCNHLYHISHSFPWTEHQCIPPLPSTIVLWPLSNNRAKLSFIHQNLEHCPSFLNDSSIWFTGFLFQLKFSGFQRENWSSSQLCPRIPFKFYIFRKLGPTSMELLTQVTVKTVMGCLALGFLEATGLGVSSGPVTCVPDSKWPGSL